MSKESWCVWCDHLFSDHDGWGCTRKECYCSLAFIKAVKKTKINTDEESKGDKK